MRILTLPVSLFMIGFTLSASAAPEAYYYGGGGYSQPYDTGYYYNAYPYNPYPVYNYYYTPNTVSYPYTGYFGGHGGYGSSGYSWPNIGFDGGRRHGGGGHRR